ncbi:uncharacterized protein LOC120633917 isoform X1 [Pararge aegeria]|uniref:Jg1206 protein n=1 Tax=Pararge aegeria aegeria TaxID=348720 RepID=A0A8S4RBM0_9NEOP|nr:uncharacterized protein LOC120633917 isoform X1 [Pararge aegeria]CAH2232887.1 jg1206 [Pararge aegeria aegeria]
MKKTSSLVWRFFDRLEENKRCVAVLCKLCDTQYKYFGNTTNLRSHLVSKHPIQWELLQNGTLDESNIRVFDDDESTNPSTSSTRRKRYVKTYQDNNVRYSVSVDLAKKGNNRNSSTENSIPVIEIQRVDVLENSETDNEHLVEGNEEPINIVRQMHGRASDEEWLNEEVYETVDYQPKRKKTKYRTIKREICSPPPSTPKYRVVPNHTYAKPLPERVSVESSQRKDEYSVFGEYVGNRLRKFRHPQVRGNVQQLITTILWQAEYGIYDNIETVKRVILHSVQEMEVEQTTEQTIIHEHEIVKEGSHVDEN